MIRCGTRRDHQVRFILIGERFFPNFQSLEIVGDMYQYTGVFFHYSWNSPEPKMSSSLTFQYFGGEKTGKHGRLKNCAKKISKNWGEKKNSPIRMTLRCYINRFNKTRQKQYNNTIAYTAPCDANLLLLILLRRVSRYRCSTIQYDEARQWIVLQQYIKTSITILLQYDSIRRGTAMSMGAYALRRCGFNVPRTRAIFLTVLMPYQVCLIVCPGARVYLSVWVFLCFLHTGPAFLPVDIRQNQRPRRFFNPREMKALWPQNQRRTLLCSEQSRQCTAVLSS